MTPVVHKLFFGLGATLYAFAGLGIRLVVARDVFLAGQTKIAGPVISLPTIHGGGGLSFTLPAEIRQSTFELFATQYSALPMSPASAAYLFTYAEFVLPVCLVLGFATRLSAFALLLAAGLIQYYSAPALWPMQFHVVALLSVLVAVGAGAISIDAGLRYLYRT
jgi:uncharacterized membrane protein YphA (DoxX/SURF4 family)